MTVHWETSRRPLFVRTVWTGKNHHAVLNELDPLYVQKDSNKLLGIKRKRVQKLGIECAKDDDDDDEINVSSVRISLASSHIVSNRKSSPRVVTPGPPKECPRSRKKDLFSRSFTVDVLQTENLKRQELVFGELPHYFNGRFNWQKPFRVYQKSFQLLTRPVDFAERQEDTTLSDRVLTWLDLAKSQNLHKLDIELRSERDESPVDNILRPKTTEIKMLTQDSFSSSFSYNMDFCYDSDEEDFAAKLMQIKPMFVAKQENSSPPLKHLSNIAPNKRELHIFLPEVAKKKGENSSVISSNLSSSLLGGSCGGKAI